MHIESVLTIVARQVPFSSWLFRSFTCLLLLSSGGCMAVAPTGIVRRRPTNGGDISDEEMPGLEKIPVVD